jgi:glycosyltransferase involved in cell wall biosynthesis
LAPKNSKKKPFRVALIASEHIVTEYRMFLGHLLVGLTDQSIPIALVCPQQSNLDSIILGAAEIIRYSHFGLPVIDHINKRVLTESLAKFKPAILHCLTETHAAITRQLARRLDLPYMLMVNSLQERWSRLPVSQKRCVAISVPAESIKVNISGIYPRYADLVRQINIGTFTARTECCFSESSRTPSIVIAHPFHNADEFEKLFGALRHLHINGHEFMIVIIGGGRVETELWKLLAASDLLPMVTFVPRIIPKRSVLAAGDIFIRPRPSTTFDPFLLEAMSVGTAVAGCKGGVDDLIIEDVTAIVFNPDDELSIVGALQKLLGRPELARKIAKNAQDYLRKNHSVSEMISSTVQIYQDVRK